MGATRGGFDRAELGIFRLTVSLSAIAVTTFTWASTPDASRVGKKQDSLFSSTDKTAISDFWSQPGRFSTGFALSASTRGVWQVRLTPEGSTWLWGLTKGHKTAASLLPTSLPQPTPITAPSTPVSLPTSLLERTSPPIHPEALIRPAVQTPIAAPMATVPTGNWDAWINRKVRHDRWQALMDARADNSDQGNSLLPPADKDTPDVEPDQPGPCPAELLSSLGVPPAFARAVQPKSYKIQFEDSSVQYEDNVRLSSPKYAYYRSADGVMSGGVPLKKFDSDRLQKIIELAGCDPSQAHVMKAVSPLEGGFDAVNTYDTGFVSVGFIQFASLREGAGSLGSVLLNYKTANPEAFDSDFHRFGIDVQPNGILDVIDPGTGDEFSGPEANAAIIRDKRLIAVFQRAGQVSDNFCAAQVRTAVAEYYPDREAVSFRDSYGTNFSCRVCDLVHCEAGMAMLFDRKVNTGNISQLVRQASLVASNHRCQSVSDLTKYEREIVSGLKYREDFTLDRELTQPR